MSAVEVHNLRKEFGRGGRRPQASPRARARRRQLRRSAAASASPSSAATAPGKSTLVRILSTLILPDGGSARLFGHDVVAEAAAVRRLVNRVSVEASFFKRMSAVENLSYAARFYGIGLHETRVRIPEILDRVGFPRSRAATRAWSSSRAAPSRRWRSRARS